MRKGFLAAELGITIIILSAITSIIFSASYIYKEFNNTEFAVQKTGYFDYMIEKAEFKCKQLKNIEGEVNINDSDTVMDNYTLSFSATCSGVEDQIDVNLLTYNQCIEGNENTGYARTENEKNCETGALYVAVSK